MRQSPPPPPPPVIPVASQHVGELLVSGIYFAVLSYVIGWSYAANFYGHFQVGLQSLQIPTEYFFGYAMYAVKQLWWWLVMFTVFIIGDLFVLWWLGFIDIYRKMSHFGKMTLWLVVGISLLVLGAKLGELAGRQAFENGVVRGFPEMPSVRVFLKDAGGMTAPAWRQRLAAPLEEGCYRMLVHNNDPGRLFLFRNTPLVTGIPVEVLAEGEVAALRILPRPLDCDGAQ